MKRAEATLSLLMVVFTVACSHPQHFVPRGHRLVIYIDAGFTSPGPAPGACRSVFAGKEVKLTDATGTIVGDVTWPEAGKHLPGFGALAKRGTCSVHVVMYDVTGSSS